MELGHNVLSGGFIFYPTCVLVTNKLLKLISIVILVKWGLLFILKHSELLKKIIYCIKSSRVSQWKNKPSDFAIGWP